MPDNCPFCEFVQSREDLIFEDEFFVTRLDYFPVSPGHAIVVPKRHITSLLWLSHDEWSSLQEAIKKTIDTIENKDLKVFYRERLLRPYSDESVRYCEAVLKHPGLGSKPDAYTHGINDGQAAGRSIEHLSWHIIPRFMGDVADPTGGIRNIFTVAPTGPSVKVLIEK